jgi:hypothetical protein
MVMAASTAAIGRLKKKVPGRPPRNCKQFRGFGFQNWPRRQYGDPRDASDQARNKRNSGLLRQRKQHQRDGVPMVPPPTNRSAPR